MVAAKQGVAEMTSQVSKTDRQIIREAAADRGCKYRITASGEAHYYGTMPNTNQDGWYFVAWTPEDAVAEIQRVA